MPQRPRHDDLHELHDLLAASQGWVATRVARYAVAQGFAQASPLAGSWHEAVAEVCAAILATIREHDGQAPPPGPPGAAPPGPLEALAARQARARRRRGARLDMYLGLLKILRRSLLDLLAERPAPLDDPRAAPVFVNRCLDAFEVALCARWTAPDQDTALDELRAGNRELSRERDLYMGALEALPDPLALVDAQGRLRHLNLAAAVRLGVPLLPGGLYSETAKPGFLAPGDHCPRTRDGLRGLPLATLLPWIEAPLAAFLAGERSLRRLDIQAGDASGPRTIRLTLARMPGVAGSLGDTVVQMTDVTDQAATLCAPESGNPRRQDDLLRLVMDHTPALVAYLDRDLRYRFANAHHAEVFHLTPADIVGRPLGELFGEQAAARMRPHCEQALAGTPRHFELPFTSPRGTTRHFDAACIPHRTGNEVAGLVLLLQDATPRKRAEQEQQRFFDVSLDMLCVTGLDGRFRKVNDAWRRILGWERGELLGLPWAAFVHPDDADAVRRAFGQLARGHSVMGVESRFRRKDGAFRWVNWNALPLLDEGQAYAVAHDTTRRREMEDVLRQLATRDSLTGACNRRQFLELAAREVDRAGRYVRPVSLLMLDIDRFKRINDTHGHPAGDEVLRALVACAGRSLRRTDVLGRVGGEEFAVLLPETEAPDALRIAERIRADVEGLAVPYEGKELRLTVSIGHAQTRGGRSLEELLKLADDALYEAKRTGRNRVVAAPAENDPAPPPPDAP